MPTNRELRSRGHSYRGFAPGEFVDVLETEIRDRGELDGRKVARGALKFVESNRLYPFLEKTSAMFDRLDRDEQEAFTRRNPDIIQWVAAYQQIEELDPLTEWSNLAADVLEPDRSRADLSQVPGWDRREIPPGETLLSDMTTRRRSYRNWTPREIFDVAAEDRELSRGQLRELDIYDAEIRREIETPVEVGGRQIGRAVLERIEAGRFEPVLSKGHKFFAPLDPDERDMFAVRNPGLIEWISAYGFTEHLIHGEQLFSLTSLEYPILD